MTTRIKNFIIEIRENSYLVTYINKNKTYPIEVTKDNFFLWTTTNMLLNDGDLSKVGYTFLKNNCLNACK